MSGVPFRCQVRVQVHDLDRDVHTTKTLVMAQHPDEPDEHILLRFLAYVLFWDDRLADAPGWTDPHEPDLYSHGLTGDLSLWVECGMPPMKRLVKALGKYKDARFVTLLADRQEAAVLRDQIVAQKPRNLEHLEIHFIPREFMDWLESIGSRNMVWSATISERTLYLDSDGQMSAAALDVLPVVSRFEHAQGATKTGTR